MSTKKKIVRGKGTPKSTPRPTSKPKPPTEKKEESGDEGKKSAVDDEVYDDKDEIEKKKKNQKKSNYPGAEKFENEDGDVEKNEWPLFLERFNNYVEEWGTSAAGRFISYQGGAPKDFPYIQLYTFRPTNASAFQKAHDKMASQLKKIMGDRPIVMGNFDIGGEGATHWVAVGHSNFGDLMKIKVEFGKFEKEWEENFRNRGPVIAVSNFIVEVLRTYGGI